MTTVVNELAIFNEEGIQLLELKRVLLSNKNNPLIYKGLKDSVVKDNFKPDVYSGFDDDIDENGFIKILMKYDKYINVPVLEKRFDEFREKISKSLERRGRKHFITCNGYSDACVNIVKKIGISKEMIMREFRLPVDEATNLLVSEFGEKFAKYKLEAIVKDIIPNIVKYWHDKGGSNYNINYELSKFYFDRNHQIYNIDFIIKVSLTEYKADTSIPNFNGLITEISTTLELLDKEYQIAKKHMNVK